MSQTNQQTNEHSLLYLSLVIVRSIVAFTFLVVVEMAKRFVSRFNAFRSTDLVNKEDDFTRQNYLRLLPLFVGSFDYFGTSNNLALIKEPLFISSSSAFVVNVLKRLVTSCNIFW